MTNSFVAFSGGIDSTALALLRQDATPVFAEMRAQMPMFTPDEVYGDALRRDDMGVACGLFCNR